MLEKKWFQRLRNVETLKGGGGQESKNDIRRRAFWGRFLKKKGKERARCKLGISGCVGVGPEGVCVRDDGVCV